MANNEKKEDRVPGITLNNLFSGKRMIIIPVAVFVIIILVVIIAGLFSGGKKAGSTVSPGVLTAAVVKGDDRFAYPGESGELVGIEPSLAAALAETEGLSLKIIEAETTDEALSFLDTKAADVAFGRITTDMGLNGYITSSDYGRSGLFLVTSIHDYTDSLAFMTGYSVGVLNNVKAASMSIPGYDYITPKDYDNAVALGEDIRDRIVNMGIVGERDAISLVKSFPTALQTQEISDSPMEHYVAVFPAGQGVHATVMNAVISSYAAESITGESEEGSSN